MMKGGRSKTTSSYSVSHAAKSKAKESVVSGNGGKMTKFKSLDDIPDAAQDYDWSHNSDQNANDNSPVYQNSSRQDNSFDNYYISEVKISPVKELNNDFAAASINQSKIPPLPYDQKRGNVINTNESNSNNNRSTIAPQSKYFDYDNSADDFEADEINSLPSPVQRSKQSNQKEIASSPAPPLPCDMGGSVVGESDSIYFSKKPRPVNFKPYTMKQYKMIQPKEYVEISNIKPDLNREELIAKRANLDRVKEFSKNLQKYNRQTISSQPKLPSASEKRDITVSEQKYNSNRQKAIEFAKNIPKPKVKNNNHLLQYTGYNDNEESGGNNSNNMYSDNFHNIATTNSNMNMGAGYEQESRIMELEAQHNNRKVQIEAIKKTMGLK